MNALKWNKEFALEQAADDAELLEELLDIFKDSLQADLLSLNRGWMKVRPPRSAVRHIR